MEAIGLFLTLAGFIIGLGAVTVIDIHGFLGRKSPYWNEATIRTHKVTKPLIWFGMSLLFVGYLILNSFEYFEPHQSIAHLIIMTIMVINGYFLSFVVSKELCERERKNLAKELLPKSLQQKIMVSFIISFVSWWGLVISTVYAILHT